MPASAAAAFVFVVVPAFLRTFGFSGGLAGFVIGAMFVITNGIPAAPLDVAERTQGIAAFALFALHSRGYFWLVVLLTPTVLFTLSAVDHQGDAVALERAAWSALGIVLGLALAELLWRLPHHHPPRQPAVSGPV